MDTPYAKMDAESKRRAEEKREWDRLPGVHVADPSQTQTGTAQKPAAAEQARESPDRAHRPIIGQLVAVSTEPVPYQNKPGARETHFATIKTAKGERTVWGNDISDAFFHRSDPQPRIGDTVVANTVLPREPGKANSWVIEKPESYEASMATARQELGLPPLQADATREDTQTDPLARVRRQQRTASEPPDRAAPAAAAVKNVIEEVVAPHERMRGQAQEQQEDRSAAPKQERTDDKRSMADRLISDGREGVSATPEAWRAANVKQPAPQVQVPRLEDRFNVVMKPGLGRDYLFRETGKVAFAERWRTMSTNSDSPEVVRGIADRLEEKGRDAIRIKTGSPEFKRQMWTAATARGIQVEGYEPTQGDRDAAAAEHARLTKERGREPGAKVPDAGGKIVGTAAVREVPPAEKELMEQGVFKAPKGPPEHVKKAQQEIDKTASAVEKAQAPSKPLPKAAAKVMEAFEAAMEAKKVPESLRAGLRQQAAEAYHQRRDQDKKLSVVVYDAQAPRQPQEAALLKAPERQRERGMEINR